MSGSRLPMAYGSMRGAIHQLLSWWGRELMGILPEGLVLGWTAPPRLLTLVKGDDDISGRVDAISIFGSRAQLWNRNGIAANQLQPVLKELRETYGGMLGVHLLLPRRECLVLERHLPAAAMAQAENIALLEIERKTPFRSEDIYWSHIVDDSEFSSAERRLRIFVVKRSRLQQLRDELKATRIPLTKIGILESRHLGGEVNLLDTSASGDRAPGYLVTRTLLVSAAALALMLGAWSASTFWQQSRGLTQLEQGVAIARSASAEVRRKIAAADAAGARVAALHERKTRRPLAVELWEELTRLLPDSAWVTELKIEDDVVSIDGYSRTAADLIGVLSRSKLVSRAEFAAPVVRDPQTGDERFRIKLNLRLADLEGPAPRASEPTGAQRR